MYESSHDLPPTLIEHARVVVERSQVKSQARHSYYFKDVWIKSGLAFLLASRGVINARVVCSWNVLAFSFAAFFGLLFACECGYRVVRRVLDESMRY